MRQQPGLTVSTEAVRKLPARILAALQASYYGGWFEIPLHGIVPGVTDEYDLNSAYPHVASRLPCMCGQWKQGTGTPGRLTHTWLTGEARTPRERALRLCHVNVRGRDPHLGPLPYRMPNGDIRRPQKTSGWYWQHEIDAARSAGLISEVVYHEWYEYIPCGHPAPVRDLAALYVMRQGAGKDTPKGKAYKLMYNSAYGKFAQSLGEPVYANPAYASLITSGCRTLILQAIATHPGKSAAVAMVATDGVYFLTPHPSLPVSEKLGEWSHTERHNLTLFKPGVYWDDKARAAIRDGKAARFKARGINAADFSAQIASIDSAFRAWDGNLPGEHDWPSSEWRSRFTQVSILQALQWSDGAKTDGEQNARYRHDAGRVKTGTKGQSHTEESWPGNKRNAYRMTYDSARGVYRSAPWDQGFPDGRESTPYNKTFGMDREQNPWEEYMTPDGPVVMEWRKALGVG
jgi:hypothetical protein